MVAYYKIDPSFRGITYFIDRFDTAVESDDQAEIIFLCKVDPLKRDAISFGITIGDIKADLSENCYRKLDQERIYKRNGGCAIYIIIPVNEDLLAFRES